MLLPVRNLGSLGIIKDVDPLTLAVNAWTDGNNVDFRDAIAKKTKGYSRVFGTLGCRPQWMIPYRDPESGDYHWIYPGLTDAGAGAIYTVNAGTHTDRTRTVGGAYAPTDEIPWTGGVLNGLAFINNGVDVPQKWDRTANVLNADFEDFANWPSGYTARVMRPFKNFMVALDIDDGTNPRNPYRVMWSNPADPFAEPSTWTPAATNRAGDVDLADGGDYLVDCLPLRGVNFVYKQESTWMMRFVGGNEVFAFDRAFSEHGLLAPRCVKTLQDGRHFVVTRSDIITHDGVTAQSVCDRRTRDYIFGSLNTEKYYKSYVAANYTHNEMWFCYPTSGADLPNKAAIWNYISNTWTFRDLDNASHIGFGVVEIEEAAWDSSTDTWADPEGEWDVLAYNPNETRMLIAKEETTAAASRFFLGDDSEQANEVNFTSYLKREGLDIAGIEGGQYIADMSKVKDVQAIWLEMTGGPVEVRVGAAQYQGDTYSWSAPQTFDPESGDYKLDVRVNGRLLGVWISSTSDEPWQVHGYSLDMTVEGER